MISLGARKLGGAVMTLTPVMRHPIDGIVQKFAARMFASSLPRTLKEKN
jgi:hypothetical protein